MPILPISWLLPAGLAALMALLWLRRDRRRLTRPARRKEVREAARDAADDPAAARAWARMTQRQLLHDALTWTWIRRYARHARLARRLAAREARVTTRRQDEEVRCKVADAKARAAAAEPDSAFRPSATRILNAALFVGDLAVVTAAIVANDPGVTVALAFVTALAIAAVLFVGGKKLAHSLRKRGRETGWRLVGTSVLLAATSVALFGLRVGTEAAWLMLAVAPALGAAGVALLGPSPLQWAAPAARRRWLRSARRLARAIRSLGRLQGRVDKTAAVSDLELVRALLRVDAEGQPLEIGTTTPRLDALVERSGLGLLLGGTGGGRTAAVTGLGFPAQARPNGEHAAREETDR